MRHCLTLDLKPDEELIQKYEEWHQPNNIPMDIPKGIKAIGILNMEIFRWENRLFMIVDTEDTFDWDIQMSKLGDMPGQKEWELLMDAYQQRLDSSSDKWKKMERIFSLSDCF